MAHNTLENYLTRIHVSLLTWDTQAAVYMRHVCEHPVYRSSSIRVVYVLLLRINYYLPWIFRRKEREKTAADRQGSRIPYTVMFACILYAQLSGHKFSREPPLCNTGWVRWNKGWNICTRRGQHLSALTNHSTVLYRSQTRHEHGVTADYFQLKTRPIGQADLVIVSLDTETVLLSFIVRSLYLFVSSRVTGRHAGH